MDLGFYFPEKNGFKKQKPQHKTVLRLFGVVPTWARTMDLLIMSQLL
jgi:hypothetical protein